MKRKALTLTLALALLFSAVAGAQLGLLAKANPFIEERYESPPVVSIHSPANGTYVNSVLVNVTVTKSADWLTTPISLTPIGYSNEPYGGLSQKLVSVSFYMDGIFYTSAAANSDLSSAFNYSLDLTDMIDGSHVIEVRANSTGVVRNWISSKVYSIPIDSSIETVHFTLDSTSPTISVLSVENKTYRTSEVALDFAVDEFCSQISYVLDGQENVIINGNTTLTGLSDGLHNVTVYAKDLARNVGASKTVFFTVAEELFPVVPVAAASVASAGIIAVGLLVYFKKRKH